MVTLLTEMEPQKAEHLHRYVRVSPHPTTSQSQLSPTWHALAALGAPGWAGGLCRRCVGGAGCRNQEAGALSQSLAAMTQLSGTAGGGGEQCSEFSARWGGEGDWARPWGGGSLEMALKSDLGMVADLGVG